MTRLALPLLVALSSAGCTHVAAERARLDLEVGKAEAEGVRVSVADGRAAVLSAKAGEVVLWASQPSMAVTLTSAEARSVELVIRNAMPNLATQSGAEIRPGARATEKRLTVLLAPGAPRTLALSPDDDGSREPFRVAMFADVQEAIDRVGDVYARMRRDAKLRFVVMNGDQTRQGSRPELERFRASFEALDFPFFMTLGNHELGTSESSYREIFGRGNHHFTYRGVHFTLLDSASATLDPLVYQWLDGWLAEGRDALHVVSMHIPPFDPVGTRNAAFASRAEGAKLIERLRRGGVDGTYYGHVHSYYAYSNGDIPAFISGGGGSIPERMDGIGRNYLTVDFDPSAGTVETALVRVD